MNFYEEMERRHPERQNQLGKNPPPPVPLLRCARCGSEPRPAFVYALYFCPCFTVRCECCGQQTEPEPWAVGLIFAENTHTVTEPEALRNACEKWNAKQLRHGARVTIRRQRRPAPALSRGCGE